MRTIIPLMKKWAFTKQAHGCPTEMPVDWVWVNLPHTWNDIDGQDGDNDYYRGVGWYARRLHRSQLPQADCYFLEITGAAASADVYFNGNLLTHHDGGYSTFRVELTEQMREDNLLVIAVDNGENQTVYPQMADFTFYGGLYREVNLICTAQSHFDLMDCGSPGLLVTPEVSGRVVMKTKICDGEYTQLRFTVQDQEGKTVTSVWADRPQAELQVYDPHLWNGRRDPYLYTAVAELFRDGEAVDRVSARFGFRQVQIDPQRGFLLNGKEYPLRGVSRHQDRWGYGSALLPKHHREDMDLICEVGANSIRLAHYQHDQYFYDLCDERGMVVWAEIPYISRHMPRGRENTLTQMKELILQNYNHPSIAVWGLSNEITVGGDGGEDLLENHRLLRDLCRQMDPSRPTAVAAVSMCPTDSPYLKIPDAVAYNHYFGWYGGDTSMNGPWFDKFHETYPDIPIGCSEYGCEALDWHSSDPKQGDYTEEYQARYHEELIRQLFPRKYLWATYVWNMFDFGADSRNEGGENGQNHKGLVTFDRKYKKDAFYAYKAWLSEEPFVHLCGKRYVRRVEDVTRVTVYSNQPRVELFANDVSLGVQEAADHFFYFDVPNRGETRLRTVAGACTDEGRLCKVDTFYEPYRLKEEGVLLNWFDLTQPEGYFSINDKISDLLANETAAQYVRDFLAPALRSAKQDVQRLDSFMDMIGGFTLLRLCNLLVQMQPEGEKLTPEQLIDCNRGLNDIVKP